MYGNFDGIKDRARLRKEVNSLRLDRLEKRKKSQTKSNRKDIFLKISKEKFQGVKKEIQKKIKKEQQHQLITYIIIFTLVISFLSFITWRYIYPFLF